MKDSTKEREKANRVIKEVWGKEETEVGQPERDQFTLMIKRCGWNHPRLRGH